MLRNATAKKLSLDKVLYCEGLSFGVVRHSRQIHLPYTQSADALIIQTASNQEFEEICFEIRNRPQIEEYLIPVFMVPNPRLNPSWKNEVDGFVDLDNLINITETTRQIHKNIARVAIVENLPQTYELEVLIKVLQYFFSRDQVMLPFPNRHSKIHFQFPFATHFFDDSNEHKLLHALKLAERKGWLMSKVVEKIHLCPDCGSAHQNLRATCPKCSSVDLNEEDLVHHFQCAFIGPISDFEANSGGDGLCCPKCDKKLRHIGNDYDKPSSIYSCNTCHHDFQQSEFKSLCVDCGADNEIHKLEEWDVKEYQLSSKGKSIVLNGTGFGKATVEKTKKAVSPGIHEFDVFKILLKQELTSRQINPRPGTIGQLKIEGIYIDKIPKKTIEEMITEVCQVIKSYLKEPDIVSSKGPGSFYFLLMETRVEEAQFLNELLSFNIQQLISSNFKGQKIEIKVKLESLVK